MVSVINLITIDFYANILYPTSNNTAPWTIQLMFIIAKITNVSYCHKLLLSYNKSPVQCKRKYGANNNNNYNNRSHTLRSLMPGSDCSRSMKELKNSARSTCLGATHSASMSAPATHYHQTCFQFQPTLYNSYTLHSSPSEWVVS